MNTRAKATGRPFCISLVLFSVRLEQPTLVFGLFVRIDVSNCDSQMIIPIYFPKLHVSCISLSARSDFTGHMIDLGQQPDETMFFVVHS